MHRESKADAVVHVQAGEERGPLQEVRIQAHAMAGAAAAQQAGWQELQGLPGGVGAGQQQQQQQQQQQHIIEGMYQH
jgi:hypothetical protein